MRRVVITGVGLVTPLASSSVETWKMMLEGKSGISEVARFDVSELPVRISGEVKERERKDDEKEWGRHSIYAIDAAEEAVAMAKLDTASLDQSMFGVVLGAGDSQTPHGPAELGDVFSQARDGDRVDLQKLEKASLDHTPRALVYESDTMMPAAHVAKHFSACGMNRTCLTACAAGSQAIGEAFKAIQDGDADVILAGGAQSLVTLEGLVGFTLLNALSSRNEAPEAASRPFDAERDGFVLSEGAGIIVLETLDHAKARGATILAEMLGYGTSADAYRVTDPHPKGEGAILCMRRALEDGKIDKDKVAFINAHGTSTKANDAAESTAIQEIFGRRVPVTSSKSLIGHLIAAAGAMELITCVLALRDKVIPPTINYETPDSACDVDLVANEPRSLDELGPVLSNSFGFGGQNVTLAVGPYEE